MLNTVTDLLWDSEMLLSSLDKSQSLRPLAQTISHHCDVSEGKRKEKKLDLACGGRLPPKT